MSNILKRINKLFSRRKTSEEILNEWSDVAKNGSVEVFKKYVESESVSMETTDFFIGGDLFLNWKGVLLAFGAKEQIEWAIENKLLHPLDVVNNNGWRFRDMVLCGNFEIDFWKNIEKNFNCWFFGGDERNKGIDSKNWSGLDFLKYIYIDSYIHQESKNKNSKNTTDEVRLELIGALIKKDSQKFELLLNSIIQRTKNLSITVGMHADAYKGLCSLGLIKCADVIAFNDWLSGVELIPSVVSITTNGGKFGSKSWHGWRRYDAVMWAESEIMKNGLVMKEKNKSCVRSL